MKYSPAVEKRRKAGRKVEKLLGRAIGHLLRQIPEGVYAMNHWPPGILEACMTLMGFKNQILEKEVNATMTVEDEKIQQVTNRLDKIV